MNPDRTKGSSFKGAIAYITHDPQQAESTERVSFTYCHNLRTSDPEKAAKIMAWTASHAEALKAQSSENRTGRKMEKPVYHLSLNWHPSEKPTEQDMIAAGKSILESLDMGEHEAVFSAHTDKQHPHMHIVVNRIHPEKGTSPSLSHDLRLLQKWAYEYEKKQGKIFCKEREAIYEDDPHLKEEARKRQKQDRTEAKEQKQVQSTIEDKNNAPQSEFKREWNKNKSVNPVQTEKANQIRSHFAGEGAKLSTQSKSLYAQQGQEKKDLYKNYETEKNRLWQDRGKSLSDVYHKTKTDHHGEWDSLKKQQRSEYSHLMYSIRKSNQQWEQSKKPKGFLLSVIDVWYKSTLVDDLRKQHQHQKESLYANQQREREGKTNERKSYHQAKSDQARLRYGVKKQQLEQKHEFERKKLQEQWRKLKEDREKAWQDLKTEQQREREEAAKKRKTTSHSYKKPTVSELFNQTIADKQHQQKQNLTTSDIPTRGNPTPHNMDISQGRGRKLEY